MMKLSLIVNMIDNLTGPMAKIQSSFGDAESKMNKLNQNFSDMTKSGLGFATTGAAIASAVLSPVAATFSTRKALGELSSVGVEDLQTLENAATNFSNQWAGTTKTDFITAAYDIKSGIASLNDEAVAKYTEIAGITAKGTKATIGEMTSLFATGYGIYKDFYKNMSDIDFGEMFAAGIGHAANIFKTDGANMSQAISSLGAAATSAKVPMEEQFAVLGMLQATMSGSEAGTKYRAFIESAARAGDTLGLKFTDANNQLLGMPEILSLLKGKFGETMDAVEKMELQKAFGTDEAVAMVDLMYTKTGELQDGILSVYDSMGGGVSEVEKMANAINQTEGEKFIVLKQNLQNITEEIGTQLLPTVNKFLSKGNEVLKSVSGWIKENESLVGTIAHVVLFMGVLLTVFGLGSSVLGATGMVVLKLAGNFKTFVGIVKNIPGILQTVYLKALYAGDGLKAGLSNAKKYGSTAVNSLKNVTNTIVTMGKAAVMNGVSAMKSMGTSILSMGRQAITTTITAMPGLIASVWAFTTALLANPVTWIVLGIVSLIAVLILLWQNWDQVTAFVKSAWNGACQFISTGIEFVKGKLKGALMFIKNLIPNFGESGKKIITTLTDGIKSMAMAPVNAVTGIFKKVRKLLPFSDAKEGPLSELTLSGSKIPGTITEGMRLSENEPAKAMHDSFGKIDLESTRKPIKQVKFADAYPNEEKESKQKSSAVKDGLTIENFFLQTDISKIKDLKLLFKLLKDIEDYQNANNLDGLEKEVYA